MRSKSASGCEEGAGRPIVIDYVPGKFTLTISSVCNLRCPTCLYLLNDANQFEGKGVMSYELYRYILDRYREHIKRITLTGGEPTLHPEIERFVDLAKEYGMDVGFPSNGTLIRRKLETFKKVSGHVQLSLDAYDFETFRRYRGGTAGQWDSILEGLELLRSNRIDFNISFLVSRDNVTEVPAMLRFADSVRPRLVNLHSYNPHGGPIDAVLRRSDERVMRVIRKVMEQSEYPFDISLPILFDEESSYFRMKTCDYPWKGVFINETGDIAYCCHLSHDRALGNISQSYDFNSPKMQSWRRMIEKRILSPDCLYCQRRFLGDEIQYNSAAGRWDIPRAVESE